MGNPVNERLDPNGRLETPFRNEVRDLLNLDVFTRDDQIFDEIRRLKAIAESHRFEYRGVAVQVVDAKYYTT
jgi:hypothetical protein